MHLLQSPMNPYNLQQSWGIPLRSRYTCFNSQFKRFYEYCFINLVLITQFTHYLEIVDFHIIMVYIHILSPRNRLFNLINDNMNKIIYCEKRNIYTVIQGVTSTQSTQHDKMYLLYTVINVFLN